MKTSQSFLTLATGIATTAVFVSPAHAFSLTTSAGTTSTVAGVTTVNFDSGLPSSGATYTSAFGTPIIVSGSLANQYAAPTGNTTPYLTIAPIGSGVIGATGAVTITFGGQLVDYFGLYAGSVDSFNQISFFRGSSLIASYSGTDIPGVSANGTSSVYANFLATTASEYFDKVVLNSNGIAFESDNHSFRAVPEPTTVAGLLIAGTMGVVLKRRQRQATLAV